MDLSHRFRATPSPPPLLSRGWLALRLRPSPRLLAGLLLLGLSLALALAAVVAANAWLEAEARRRAAGLALPEPRIRLLVANRALAAGTRLSAGLVTEVDWPADALVAGARPIDPAALNGARLASPVPAGMPLLAGHLASGTAGGLAARLAPGMRAIGLPAEAAGGLAGLIAPGDRVDLHYSARLPDGRTLAGTALSGLRVLGPVDPGDPAAEGAAHADGGLSSTIMLEVPAADVEAVALLLDQASVSLSLRGQEEGDDTPAALPGLAARLAPLVAASAMAAGAAAAAPAIPVADARAARPAVAAVHVARGHSVRGDTVAAAPPAAAPAGEGGQ